MYLWDPGHRASHLPEPPHGLAGFCNSPVLLFITPFITALLSDLHSFNFQVFTTTSFLVNTLTFFSSKAGGRVFFQHLTTQPANFLLVLKDHLPLFLPFQADIDFCSCSCSLCGLFPISIPLCPGHCLLKTNCSLSIQLLSQPPLSLFSHHSQILEICSLYSLSLLPSAHCFPPPQRPTTDFFEDKSKAYSPIPSTLLFCLCLLGNIFHFVFVLLFKHCFLWLFHPQSRGQG